MNRTNIGQFAEKFTTKLKRVLRIAGMVCALGWVVYGSYSIGAFDKGRTLVAYAEATSTPAQLMAPVLERIADCESGNGKAGTATHYEHGQVLLRANAQGTNIDIGKYQINIMFWGKKATELGYDLTKEADNKAMAEWIFMNKGTGDWSASQKCWYR